jgi:hypothetical protein
MRRALLSYLVFAVAEWATWIAGRCPVPQVASPVLEGLSRSAEGDPGAGAVEQFAAAVDGRRPRPLSGVRRKHGFICPASQI